MDRALNYEEEFVQMDVVLRFLTGRFEDGGELQRTVFFLASLMGKLLMSVQFTATRFLWWPGATFRTQWSFGGEIYLISSFLSALPSTLQPRLTIFLAARLGS